MSSADAHYGGNLVDGAKILSLFGDVATELLIGWTETRGCFSDTTRSSFWPRSAPETTLRRWE
jgi:3-aminobutyryl-CoA ammonia-lyase